VLDVVGERVGDAARVDVLLDAAAAAVADRDGRVARLGDVGAGEPCSLATGTSRSAITKPSAKLSPMTGTAQNSSKPRSTGPIGMLLKLLSRAGSVCRSSVSSVGCSVLNATEPRVP
jgi:hypothetical protein